MKIIEEGNFSATNMSRIQELRDSGVIKIMTIKLNSGLLGIIDYDEFDFFQRQGQYDLTDNEMFDISNLSKSF